VVGRVVEIQLQSRRFRCGNAQCAQRIFTERLSEVVRPKARRTLRLGQSQLAIGFAVGGEPGSRLAHKLAMPVSGDTLLRMIRAAEFETPDAPRVVGIDDWAWRKGQRYGTIICDLERGRILDLLPDRNADTVAAWLECHPGIEIVARDRAGLYADGARRGAPEATQVADRWHLLNNLGEALRLAVGRHRKAVRAAGTDWSAELGDMKSAPQSPSETDAGRDDLRQLRRNERRDRYAEILHLRQAGLSPRQIAPRIGMNVRTVERWLAAGGEPEHHRPPVHSTCIDPFRDYLEQRLRDGQHNGALLWAEITQRGFEGSRATLYRWLSARLQKPEVEPAASRGRPPSRRACAWLLSEEPSALDDATQSFLRHLFEHAPELQTAGELARRFAALIRGDDELALEKWIADAAGTEMDALAKGIRRDIGAVKAAITYPWSTSPVEGRINRLKTLKRQMYGRAGCQLLRSRLLAAA
jgi:transposase